MTGNRDQAFVVIPINDAENNLPGRQNTEPIADSSVLECRICQEEDDLSKLEAPCTCSGSLKYAHQKCVQRWCNEKGDTTCEICQQPYKHGYSAPYPRMQPGNVPTDLSDDWGIPGADPMDFRHPRILALAAAQRRLLALEYEEYVSVNDRSDICCRTMALVLMTLLLLRHTISMAAGPADSNSSTFVMIFILRIVGFFLPCYIMARAMNMLQGAQQQTSTMTAAEVSVLLQAGHPGETRVALAQSNLGLR